jgi:hypothetical protein
VQGSNAPVLEEQMNAEYKKIKQLFTKRNVEMSREEIEKRIQMLSDFLNQYRDINADNPQKREVEGWLRTMERTKDLL